MRHTATDSSTHGDFVGWVDTWDDLILAKLGQYRRRLLRNHGRPGDTGYAGLEVLPDGSFVSTTYCVMAHTESPLMVSLRFDLDEIDQRATNLDG
ncbi:MAG: hypothetical protein CME05_04580 [Gemmatimonadaceae bacterium]|nr:hypothetical protein [Gemmatimonadaceae bacterium]